MDYAILDAIYAIPQHEIAVDVGFNCRGAFTPQSVHGLSQSIEENGLLEPIIIQPIADLPEAVRPGTDALYRIIAGHRREAAIRWFLKWETLPCRIVEGLEAEQAQVLNFVENLEREDLNMLEEAEAIERVWPDVTATELEKRLKRNPRWIRARRRLLKLPDDIKQAAASGRIGQFDVEFIGRADTPDEQRRLYENVLEAKQHPDRTVRYRKLYGGKRTRPMKQLTSMVSYLMEHGADERITSVLAWASGHIATKELLTKRLGLPFSEDMFDE